jgi:hypothetical protein
VVDKEVQDEAKDASMSIVSKPMGEMERSDQGVQSGWITVGAQPGRMPCLLGWDRSRLARDEARRIAANTVKLPDLLTKRAGALHGQIIDEICKALERLGADAPLLSVVGSIGDTMNDDR